MQYLRHCGLVGLVTAATLMLTPGIISPAVAQTPAALEALDLTPEQLVEVRAIVTDTQAAIGEVLTDQQQQQFQAVYSELQDVRSAVAAIDNLTSTQQNELRSILLTSREELSDVLTDEQLAELQSQQSERRRR